MEDILELLFKGLVEVTGSKKINKKFRVGIALFLTILLLLFAIFLLGGAMSITHYFVKIVLFILVPLPLFLVIKLWGNVKKGDK